MPGQCFCCTLTLSCGYRGCSTRAVGAAITRCRPTHRFREFVGIWWPSLFCELEIGAPVSPALWNVHTVFLIWCRDVKALRPVWPRGQIIRPRPRPRCIWPQPHRSWPRGLEICSLYGLVNNLIFSSPYSQSNHQRSFLLCIGYLLKTTNLQIFFLLLSGHPVIFSLDVLQRVQPRPRTLWPRPRNVSLASAS